MSGSSTCILTTRNSTAYGWPPIRKNVYVLASPDHDGGHWQIFYGQAVSSSVLLFLRNTLIYNVSVETCASSIATTGRTPRGPRWSRTTFLTFANVVQRCTKVLMSDQGNVQTSRWARNSTLAITIFGRLAIAAPKSSGTIWRELLWTI